MVVWKGLHGLATEEKLAAGMTGGVAEWARPWAKLDSRVVVDHGKERQWHGRRDHNVVASWQFAELAEPNMSYLVGATYLTLVLLNST